MYDDLRKRGNRVLNRARQLAPVDQGTLRASLHMETIQFVGGDSLAVRIGSNLAYAVYVHEGTGVYGKGSPITPKSGRFLVWPMKNNSGRGNRRYKAGKTQTHVFAKSVRGMPGRPFLLNAIPAAR